jgi:hypothetical protein
MYVPRWIVVVISIILVLNGVDSARSLYGEIQAGLQEEVK